MVKVKLNYSYYSATVDLPMPPFIGMDITCPEVKAYSCTVKRIHVDVQTQDIIVTLEE